MIIQKPGLQTMTWYVSQIHVESFEFQSDIFKIKKITRWEEIVVFEKRRSTVLEEFN